VHRFFAPALDPGDEAITLPRDEGEHLTRVLRLGAGDTVAVFDGRGNEFLARVMTAARRDVRVQLVSRIDPPPELPVSLTLAQAVLKGEKMDDVVRDAVMLGVAAIQPVVTGRTEVTVATLERARRRERWERIAIASAKQCGRAVVPSVREPIAFEALAPKLAPLTLTATVLMLVEPGASREALPLGQLDSKPSAEAMIIVGPEGGWTPEEVQTGAQACRLITLGARTLRADVMAIVAMTALFTAWKEF
jgi:16S rRNA (uracil1498-N3)-methyltransferase